jgi:hypothetical protein
MRWLDCSGKSLSVPGQLSKSTKLRVVSMLLNVALSPQIVAHGGQIDWWLYDPAGLSTANNPVAHADPRHLDCRSDCRPPMLSGCSSARRGLATNSATVGHRSGRLPRRLRVLLWFCIVHAAALKSAFLPLAAPERVCRWPGRRSRS